VNAAGIVKALQRHHQEPDWVCIPEAPDGKWSPRRCDLLVVHSWKSRKFEVHGYEIKCTRADWAKELADPAKGESWWRWCDRWSLAVPADQRAAILSAGAVPAGWGLVTIGEGPRPIRWVTQPELHPKDPWPWELVAIVMSTIDRRRSGEVNRLVSEQTADLQRELRDAQAKLADHRADRLANELHELRRQIELFEHETGLEIMNRSLRGFGGTIDPQAAAVIKLVRDHFKHWGSLERLGQIAAQLQSEADRWSKLVAELGLPTSSRRAV